MVDNGFAEADERRRGRISLPDLFKPSNSLGLRGPCDHDAITKLARFLDTNPNSDHLLSFPDYIVIAYLVTAGLRLCSSCSLPVIPMLGYSCRACWEMAAPSSPPAFDLCLPCYSSRRFPPHPHPPSSFIDQSILYTLMLHTSTQLLSLVEEPMTVSVDDLSGIKT
ncbi:hypothetical protein L7F22_002954 [Adiantum nelumboides]|nr:hypothetical protein [Adiantum nelumboides]